jgi:type IV pilus assembly protein PilX
MNKCAKFSNKRIGLKNQQGLVLFIALVVLVVMTLAGIAMLRQLSGGLGIIGNLSFKENATLAGDLGVEAARAWLVTRSSAQLIADDAGTGYYSSWDPTFDPNKFNWSDGTSSDAINDGAGNDVRFIIHRLCGQANVAVNTVGQNCVTLTVAGSNSTKIGLDANTQPLSNTIQPYYRITTRTIGPRNTLSIVQVIMY